MKARLVPMEVEHYVAACPHVSHPERAAEACLVYGPAFSAFIDDELAGVAGVMIGFPGVGEAWAVLTDLGREHPMVVHRLTVRTLRTVAKEYQLYRLTVDVDASFTKGRHWAEALGFHPESMMLWGGPNKTDLVRYRMLAID